jgi:hypothetical protein
MWLSLSLCHLVTLSPCHPLANLFIVLANCCQAICQPGSFSSWLISLRDRPIFRRRLKPFTGKRRPGKRAQPRFVSGFVCAN